MPALAHPTREEWNARHVNLPEAAKTTLARVAEAHMAAKRAAITLAERRAESLREHRAKLEVAVAAELVRLGAEWLAKYRTLGPATLGEFDSDTDKWAAEFNPEAVGVHPMRFELFYCLHIDENGHKCRQWRPESRWTVLTPDHHRQFNTFEMALACACDYCPTPF